MLSPMTPGGRNMLSDLNSYAEKGKVILAAGRIVGAEPSGRYTPPNTC